MRVLRFLRKWWRDLWSIDFSMHTPLDTHSWGHKCEIYRRLKRKRF